MFSNNGEGFEVIFPEDIPDLGDFSLIKTFPIKTGSVKGRGPGMEYVMGVYSTGIHVIPEIKIPYRKTGAPDTYFVYSQQIPIEVTSLLSPQDKDIRDIDHLEIL